MLPAMNKNVQLVIKPLRRPDSRIVQYCRGKAAAIEWRPCGVTWDAVPEQSWLLKLRRKPAFKCTAIRLPAGVRTTVLCQLQGPRGPA